MSVRCFVVSAALAGFVPAGQGSEQAAQNPREAIVPMGVTTSSTQTEAKSPQRLIDGWGLAEPAADGSWCHSSNAFRYQGVERGSMWSSGDDDYSGQAVSLQKAVEARYVRLHGLSHWGGERCGLSEVRFFTGGAGAAGAIAPGVRPAVRTAQGPEPNRPNPPRPAVPGAENIVFPVNAGIIDVTAAPYNARGDGKTDDTRAIQQALRDYADQGVIIYLPNGTYLISKTLRWGTNQKLTTLQGQSRAGTILRLQDACPGFTDPGQPAAMVWTGDMPAQRFRNQIRNCTWDTGRGNPGAIGVRFNASNCGCLRDVAVRSGDGTGIIGLDLSYTDDYGPFLVKNVSVAGFDTGIATKHGVNGSSTTCQVPSCAAVAVFTCPANSTLIFSPRSAQPQTFTGLSRCKTMWSPKTRGSRNSGAAEEATIVTKVAKTSGPSIAREISGVSFQLAMPPSPASWKLTPRKNRTAISRTMLKRALVWLKGRRKGRSCRR